MALDGHPWRKEPIVKKILATILFVCYAVGTATADPVTRRSADRYEVAGAGEVFTKSCTVTAAPSLSAEIVRDRKRSWIVFVDRDGEEEAQCEVKFVVSYARRVGNTMVAVRR